MLYQNSVFSSVPAIPGDSGGILVDADNGIMGILGSMLHDIVEVDFIPGKRLFFNDPHRVLAVKINKALELVDFYKQKVKSRL